MPESEAEKLVYELGWIRRRFNERVTIAFLNVKAAMDEVNEMTNLVTRLNDVEIRLHHEMEKHRAG